jgi:hypothetical protein
MRRCAALFFVLLAGGMLAVSQTSSPPESMGGMDMAGMHKDGTGKSGDVNQGNAEAMHSMELRHMDMGPHMKMTAMRPPQPGDKEKADEVERAARSVAERYRDYRVAVADGFRIFLPNVPQKQYHFTNYRYAWQARNNFDPHHPTSLLYEKSAEGYKLIGVMYTAKKDAREEELNARIPLSIAQWHAHVNLCMPPNRKENDVLSSNPKFGLRGSIASKEACDAAGGKFFPQIFGWMVHVYPFEKNSQDVWSVERQGHMD